MFRTTLIGIASLLIVSGPTLADDPPLGDPMRPYIPSSSSGGDQPAASPFTLTGVLVAATRRVAVINGALYREGDTINGARVVRIDPASVQLRRGNEDFALKLQRRTTVTRTNNGESVQ